MTKTRCPTVQKLQSYYYLVPHQDKPGQSLLENVFNPYQKFLFSWCKKKFFAVESHTDFYKILLETPENERNYYEIIPNGWQKLHFDIDIKRKDIVDPQLFTIEYAESIKDHLIKGILEFFSSHVKELFFLHNDVIVFTSHGSQQFSYHIIIDNFAFPGPTHCKEITLKIVNNVPEDMKKYVDLSVNKSHQQFRLWRCCKEGETSPRFKEISQDWCYFGKPIHWEPRHNNDPRWSFPEMTPHLLGLLYFERTLISRFPASFIKVSYELPSVSPNKTTCTEEIGDVNVAHLEKLIPSNWTLGTINGNFVKLLRTHPRTCPLCDRIHEKDNQNYLVILGKRQNVYLKCFRTTPETAKQSIYLGCLNPDYEYTKEKQHRLREQNPVQADQSYNKQYVKAINPIPGTILMISSYLGTGKTTAFIEYIKKTNPQRVLVLSPRQLYARSVTSEYNMTMTGESFKCYLDVEDVTNCDRLVLQMESLHKLIALEKAPPFDVLVLDEIEALLKQFSSTKTMKDLIGCSNVFERLVRETPIIIGGDAFLGMKSIKTLKAINPQVSVIRNDYSPPKRQVIIYSSWSALVYRALTSLRIGKKIVFVLGSRKKALEFAAECSARNISYKIYTGLSENVEQDRQDLANVREAWSQIQCLIYTSTITVGVNFDTLNVFDELFAYGTSYGCTVRDTFQGLLRVRHIKDNILHVALYSNPTNSTLPVTRKAIKEVIAFKVQCKLELTQETSIERGHTLLTIISENKETEHLITTTWQFAPEWLRICQIENILEDNLNKTKYQSIFEKFLNRCNYDVLSISQSPEYELPKTEEILHYNEIPDINARVYQDLQIKLKSGLANRMEHKMVDKYMFNKLIRGDIDINSRHEFFAEYEKNKKTFFNLYAEKYQSISTQLDKEIRSKYVEFASDDPKRLDLIRKLNQRFNIKYSCQGFSYIRQTDGQRLYPVLAPLLPELEVFFQITSTANSLLLNLCKRVEKVYEFWTGIKKHKKESRKQVNFQREYIQTITFESKTNLWEAMQPWTNNEQSLQPQTIEIH